MPGLAKRNSKKDLITNVKLSLAMNLSVSINFCCDPRQKVPGLPGVPRLATLEEEGERLKKERKTHTHTKCMKNWGNLERGKLDEEEEEKRRGKNKFC